MRPDILYEVRVDDEFRFSSPNREAAQKEYELACQVLGEGVTLLEVCTSLLATDPNKSVCQFSVVDIANSLGYMTDGWDLKDAMYITGMSEEECRHHLDVRYYANEYIGTDEI